MANVETFHWGVSLTFAVLPRPHGSYTLCSLVFIIMNTLLWGINPWIIRFLPIQGATPHDKQTQGVALGWVLVGPSGRRC